MQSDIHKSIEEHIIRRCKETIDAATEKLQEEYQIKNTELTKEFARLHEQQDILLKNQKMMEITYNECKDKLYKKEEIIARACENTSQCKYVKINIGGQIFETKQSTLTSISPYFARIFSDDFDSPTKDFDGNVFIDMPSVGFQEIINWVRLGRKESHFKKICMRMANYPNNLFLETMDFLGIHPNDSIFEKGMKIKIYWRGDRNIYTATILSSIIDLPNIKVKYDTDGEVWEYDYIKLRHDSGKYKNYNADPKTIDNFGKPEYWHYGIEKGSIKIGSGPGESKEKSDDSSSSDSDSEVD
jgi:hypothetical protein